MKIIRDAQTWVDTRLIHRKYEAKGFLIEPKSIVSAPILTLEKRGWHSHRHGINQDAEKVSSHIILLGEEQSLSGVWLEKVRFEISIDI